LKTERAQIRNGFASLWPRLVRQQDPAEKLGAARDARNGTVMIRRGRDFDTEIIEQFGAAKRNAVLP